MTHNARRLTSDPQRMSQPAPESQTSTRYRFENLEIWQHSLELTQMVYHLTGRLPRSEAFGLSDQMRRATVSVGLNIAEGRAADSDAEFRRFLGISLRSLVEVVACLRICESLAYISPGEGGRVCSYCDRLMAKIKSFRKALSAV
jgi:four helix bundle protein